MIKSQPVTIQASPAYKSDNTNNIEQISGSEDNLGILRNIKIGSFNIGSALADILGSGVWNRIMIADLGFAATPVSLLLSLNYFMAPFVVLTGQKSDHTNIRGYRRLPWVWGGRSLIAIGYLLLAFFTVELATTKAQGWWLGIILALSLTGIGTVLSGSAYTALIYDRAPKHQRGRAMGLAWTMLLFGYAVSGVLFARLLPEYSTAGVLGLFTTTVLIISGLWFFSVLGEEKRQTTTYTQPQSVRTKQSTFWEDFQAVWSQRTTRLFFLYIGLSFMGAFAQDQILEPFGAQVFDLSTGETSRFAAFWGTTALLGSILALYLQRKISRYSYERINRYGIFILITTFGLLGMSSFMHLGSIIRPILLLFGIGLGMWNIGTWGLMVSVSDEQHTGTYFGLWTMASLIFRGGGAVLGAMFRDVIITISNNISLSYGLVFFLEAVVLIAALIIIRQVRFDTEENISQNQVLAIAGAD